MVSERNRLSRSSSIFWNSTTFGSWTLISRIFGFIRDLVLAAFLGAGPVAEAFLIAFSLPNMFRRIFAEGAFNSAFVPIYSKKLKSNEMPAEFANQAFSGLAFILILLTIVAQLAMPLLVVAMAGGFIGDQRFDLAVMFGRIAFPYILFISLVALISAMLNAADRFAASAAAPVLLNAFFIAALVGADFMQLDMGYTLAWAAPVAGIGQLILVWVALNQAGYSIQIKWPQFTPEMKRLAVIAAPAILAGGVVQVNLVIGRQVASIFDGAVAWLSYADRMYQLPLGVVGVAIGIVLLPDLSKRLASEDSDGAKKSFSRATELALGLAVPAAVALMVMPLPIIQILFERGNFTPIDTAGTSAALAVYAAGLPAFVLQKTVQTQFFARHDTRTPFLCALVALFVNAAVAFGLIGTLGYLAAALGATVAGWILLLLLILNTRQMKPSTGLDRRSLVCIPKILFAAAIMGLLLYFAIEYSFDLVVLSPLRYLWLAGMVSGGVVIYGSILFLLGGIRIDEVKKMIRR